MNFTGKGKGFLIQNLDEIGTTSLGTRIYKQTSVSDRHHSIIHTSHPMPTQLPSTPRPPNRSLCRDDSSQDLHYVNTNISRRNAKGRQLKPDKQEFWTATPNNRFFDEDFQSNEHRSPRDILTIDRKPNCSYQDYWKIRESPKHGERRNIEDWSNNAAIERRTTTTNRRGCLTEMSDIDLRKDDIDEVTPMIAMLRIPSSKLKLAFFTGDASEESFVNWIRKFEDFIETATVAMNEETKARHLRASLDGMAREVIEELTVEQQKDYAQLVNHLKLHFASDSQKYFARQELNSLKQGPGESCSKFAFRIRELIKQAYDNVNSQEARERQLDTLLNGLRKEIRYHTRLNQPKTFKEAVDRSVLVENLMSEMGNANLYSSSISALGRAGEMYSNNELERDNTRTDRHDDEDNYMGNVSESRGGNDYRVQARRAYF